MTAPPASAIGCGCSRPADFVLQHWPDGVVVYDDARASLQALHPVAGEAFEILLTQGRFDAASLARVLFEAEPSPEDIELVASLLVEFESMGLIECTQG
ncbi:MAG: hypothetical protein AB7S86_08745 [Hydrogenophaga sp.]|uniref:hypothetical protein n=1 Tax=Hydrogenophaga sp. TaxID=1904254 RepID=UPI003D0C6190